jgi:hypothetical protein
LRDHAGAADFRAGPGRRRHGDDRRDLVGVRARPPIADILEIPQWAALPGRKRDDLARVEARAAAEGDDAVMFSGAEGDDAGFDVSLDRVRLNVGEHGDRKPRLFEKAERLLRDRELGKARIRHE